MSNLIGNRFRVLVYGQSHSPCIGADAPTVAGFREELRRLGGVRTV